MHPLVPERRVVFLIAAVQFINILDFMMVMPLGPDFATALDIPVSHLGFVGGSYTAAAAASGVLGAFVLDRFDRRKALAVALAGLVVGTVAGGFATGLGTMLAARVLAGAFGGPAAALSLAIISDVVPLERRGRAMGVVMVANFLLVPNLAAYWMFNFGYPRERLSLLYLVGGILSFFTMPIAGRMVDRYGCTGVAALGTALTVLLTFPVFVFPIYTLPVLAVFSAFMAFGSFRIIPMQTLGTRVPRADERARYMSAQAAVQHTSAAVGSIVGAQMLTEGLGGELIGMNVVGWWSVGLATLMPVLVWMVERRLRPAAVPPPLSETGPAIHPV